MEADWKDSSPEQGNAVEYFAKLNFVKRKGEDLLEISDSSTPELSPSTQRKSRTRKSKNILEREAVRSQSFARLFDSSLIPPVYFGNEDEEDDFSQKNKQKSSKLMHRGEYFAFDLIHEKQVQIFEKQFITHMIPPQFLPLNDGTFSFYPQTIEKFQLIQPRPFITERPRSISPTTSSSSMPSSAEPSPPMLAMKEEMIDSPPAFDTVKFLLVEQPDSIQRKCYEKENRF
jgi:hypothetical protein